ncbi:MAG: hypothetical protein LN589_04495 [Rickettsia endosymbiont of Eriopis connexa]|nr:hypothetical protein [Rickettsia endosymbiont of Eriopis connexa]
MGTVRYPNYSYNNDYINQINKEDALRRLQEQIEEVERKQAMQNIYQIHSSTWPSL